MKKRQLSGEQVSKILGYQDQIIRIASEKLEANNQKLLDQQISREEIEIILENNRSLVEIQRRAWETLIELSSKQESSVDWKAELEQGFRTIVATMLRIGVNRLEHMDLDSIIKLIHDYIS